MNLWTPARHTYHVPSTTLHQESERGMCLVLALPRTWLANYTWRWTAATVAISSDPPVETQVRRSGGCRSEQWACTCSCLLPSAYADLLLHMSRHAARMPNKCQCSRGFAVHALRYHPGGAVCTKTTRSKPYRNVNHLRWILQNFKYQTFRPSGILCTLLFDRPFKLTEYLHIPTTQHYLANGYGTASSNLHLNNHSTHQYNS